MYGRERHSGFLFSGVTNPLKARTCLKSKEVIIKALPSIQKPGRL